MKITKYGHCCMLIEEQGLRILTDPGIFTTKQNEVNNVDALLITHEHPDHYHIESVKEILKNNPEIKIVTTEFVGALLEKEGIKHEILKHGESVTVKDILIEGFGELHAQMHSSIPQSTNIGFFIADKFFHPGDALTNPGKHVEILCLPVAGPWLKLSEAVDYAIQLNPKIVIPVHEAVYVMPELGYRIPRIVLEKNNIKFVVLGADKETEF